MRKNITFDKFKFNIKKVRIATTEKRRCMSNTFSVSFIWTIPIIIWLHFKIVSISGHEEWYLLISLDINESNQSPSSLYFFKVRKMKCLSCFNRKRGAKVRYTSENKMHKRISVWIYIICYRRITVFLLLYGVFLSDKYFFCPFCIKIVRSKFYVQIFYFPKQFICLKCSISVQVLKNTSNS